MRVEHFRALHLARYSPEYWAGRERTHTSQDGQPHAHWELTEVCKNLISRGEYRHAARILGMADGLQTRYYPTWKDNL